jgi:hypothetical protein
MPGKRHKAVTSLFAGALLCMSCEVAAAKHVMIVTMTTGGTPINAKLEKRLSVDRWQLVPGQFTSDGHFETDEANCDGTIEYRASDDSGMYVRIVAVTKFCTEPEVVFNDFVPANYALWSKNSIFLKGETWVAVLGDSPDAVTKGNEAATAFEAAITNGQYGRVAFMANEMAAQLRNAGNSQAADYMGALAIDATTRGVLQAQGQQPDAIGALVPDKSGKPILSFDAKVKISKYQVEVLGVDPKSTSLGRVDLKTIRSLDGGNATNAEDWKLNPKTLTKFDVTPFVKG